MSELFSPLRLRQLTLKNRVVVSPMCMYSSENGYAGDFHRVHLGSLALGGSGLIITEATAVSPEGRITPEDLGLWRDEHIVALAEIADFVHAQGSLLGIQLAHAGRKASAYAPWRGHGEVPTEAGGWEVVGPSDQPFNPTYPTPRAMTEQDMLKVIEDFRAATARALMVGADTVEVHAAHGYLLHQFLSPLSNTRTDDYGDSFENRVRFPIGVIRAVREAWPSHLPVFVRLSATDWVPGGWDLEQTVELCKRLHDENVDVIDVSSGGLSPDQQVEVGPGYQLGFAEAVKRGSGLPTMAVGLITDPEQAERALTSGQADLIALARVLLRDPHWPQAAERALDGQVTDAPKQYERAWK